MSIGKNLEEKKLGERIKAIRKEKKITQKQLGELIGKKEITIRKYENGQIAPTLEVITKIAEALDTSISKLVTEKGKTHIYNETSGEHYLFDTPYVENDNTVESSLKISSISVEIQSALDKYIAIISPHDGDLKATNGKADELSQKILDLIQYEIYKEQNNKK